MYILLFFYSISELLTCCYKCWSWKVAYRLPFSPSHEIMALKLSHVSDNLIIFSFAATAQFYKLPH